MNDKKMYQASFKLYAMPMIIRSVFSSIMHTADRTIAALFIGASALVATTLISPLLYLIYGISALFIGGLGAYIGLLIGRDQKEKARRVSSGILIVLGFLGLALTLVTLVFGHRIIAFLGARGPMISMASTYLRVISVSFSIMLVARALDVIIYNDGSPKYSFRLNMITTVMNLTLNIFTVAVLNLGIFGLAFSTLLSEGLMLIGGLYYYIFKAKIIKISRPTFKIKTILRIAYNGLSDFAMLFVDGIMIFVLNQAFIRFLSPSHFEGYAAANLLIFIFYGIFMGASMGLQPIHSQMMGRKDFDHLKGLLSYSIKKAMMIGWLVFGISIPISAFVLKLFVSSPQALTYGRFFYISLGFAVMFSNIPLQTTVFFTAINRPLESLAISLARTLVLIPLIAYTAIALWGPIGVSLGYLLSDLIIIAMLGVYMKKVDLKTLKVYD